MTNPETVYGMTTAADVYARLEVFLINNLTATRAELIKLRDYLDDALDDINASLDGTAGEEHHGFCGDRASDLAAALTESAETVHQTRHMDDLLHVFLLGDPTLHPDRILWALAELDKPASAAQIAARLSVPQQAVINSLRTMEEQDGSIRATSGERWERTPPRRTAAS